MAWKDYRQESRGKWGSGQARELDRDQIKTGCLLRIADATELMAKNYEDLISARDCAVEAAEYWKQIADSNTRSNTALRGQITKLRRRIAQLDGR